MRLTILVLFLNLAGSLSDFTIEYYIGCGFAINGLPCGSAGKESACSAGDLAWENPLEKGNAPHSSILAWRIPRTVYSLWGHKEPDTTERLSLPL